MQRTRHFLCFLLWGGIVVAAVAVAEGRSSPLPPPGSIFQVEALEAPPESLLLDQARLFDEHESSRLSARLREFRSLHGTQVYVVAYSVLIGETIDERAKRLRENWLADDSGIIVGYQRGNDRITFSSTTKPLKHVLKSDLELLFTEAYEAAAEQSAASDRVIAAVDLLLSGLAESIVRQHDSKSLAASEARSFVTWALGLLILLASAGMLAFHLMRRSQIQVSKSYAFPPVKIVERFGASYSGGCQAEIEFTARRR